MKKIAVLLLLLLNISVCSFAQRAQDSLALVALFNSTGGADWTNKTNWLSSEPISKWVGVTVENNRVYALDLDNNKLAGVIPPEIGNLIYLNELNFTNNQIGGKIPNEIGSLTRLIGLYLDGNLLDGTIPSEIGNLTNLQSLRLNYNMLSGSIPIELGNLINLKELFSQQNQLSGSIPKEIGKLTNLIFLNLCLNNLSGNIPIEIWNLTNLGELNVMVNLLSGTIPNEINNLTKLYKLVLFKNIFTGLPKLNLSLLDFLVIEDNRFTFEDIEPNFNVAKTEFYYSPQESIGKEQNVSQRINKSYTFKVSCGGTHNQYQWYKNNVVIPLATNSDFTIPILKQSDAGSYTCNVTNTVVTGLTINSKPINLTVTLNGRAKDSLALVTIYNTLHGETWTNNTNWLSSEPISTWYGVTVGSNTGGKGELYDTTSVVSLNLSGNNLNGQIPEAIGDMIALQTLKLDDNHLSGSVPTEINNITSLQTLELSKNKLDELPTLTLTLLDTLLIDNNQFSFEDILPNLSIAAKGFTYFSQDSIGIKKDTICYLNSSIEFIANDSSSNNIYQWYKDEVNIPQTTNNTYLKSNLQHSDAGSYTCTITNTSVPGLTVYQRPVKLLVSTITGVDDVNNPEFKVFPNPTGGIIYIETSRNLSSDTKIDIIDVYGKTLIQKNWVEGSRQELNLMHLSKGMYFIRIHNKNANYFQKIVIR